MTDDAPPAADRGFEPGASHLLPRYRDGDGDRSAAAILHRSAPRAIEWAAEQIAAGGVVSIPTDTVYGIAGSLAHPQALDRIFAIKQRQADHPLPILVSSSQIVRRLTSTLDPNVSILLDTFWPGPLTVVIPATGGMPPHVMGPGETIGVRLPNHPLAIEVIDKAGGAIACTSANLSGQEPATTAADVARSLGGSLDLILDGGLAPGGIPSTVVALEGETLRMLRSGAVAEDLVRDAWQQILAGA